VAVTIHVVNPEVDIHLSRGGLLEINLVALSDECLVIYANERTAA